MRRASENATDKMTTGEIIRELVAIYGCADKVKLAVNEHRRVNGLKNWAIAAADLLQGWWDSETETEFYAQHRRL